VFTGKCPIDVWPDLRSTSIIMREDRAVGPSSRRTAARIGTDLIELDGSHSPFYSRPAELLTSLVDASVGNDRPERRVRDKWTCNVDMYLSARDAPRPEAPQRG
jgi:hypothetical protein